MDKVLEGMNGFMLYNILIPIGIFVLFSISGIVVEKVIISKLLRLIEKSPFKIDSVALGAFKGMFVLWASMAGAYIAILWAFGDAYWVVYAIKAIISVLIVSISIVIARIVTGIVNVFSKKAEGILPSTSMFANLTKLLVYILGILILLQYLGISITPILTALGVGGLALALALQDTLANIFAGLHILLSGQIKPGDYIKLDTGDEGFIADISLRNTSIRMASNSMLLIPNLKLSGAIVTNHELPERQMSVVIKVGVSYESDLENVERIVCKVASEVMKEVAGGVPEFEPFLRFHTFSDFSIDFNVILRAKTFGDQYIVKHEFIKRLHKRFIEEGIEVPFPIQTICLK
jgi:small-conductance mechanosensitive channel